MQVKSQQSCSGTHTALGSHGVESHGLEGWICVGDGFGFSDWVAFCWVVVGASVWGRFEVSNWDVWVVVEASVGGRFEVSNRVVVGASVWGRFEVSNRDVWVVVEASVGGRFEVSNCDVWVVVGVGSGGGFEVPNCMVVGAGVGGGFEVSNWDVWVVVGAGVGVGFGFGCGAPLPAERMEECLHSEHSVMLPHSNCYAKMQVHHFLIETTCTTSDEHFQ